MKINKTQRLLLLVVIIALGGTGIFFIGAYTGLWAGTPDVATEKLTSTFTLIDYRTGEDVTAWVEVSVWTPDDNKLPFDEDEDPYILTNFDEEVSSSDAGDVAIDLRDHAVAWLEVDPDFESDYGGYVGTYNTTSGDFRRIYGGTNYDYTFYVYHLPENVSITVRDRITNDEWGNTYTDVNKTLTDDGHLVVELDVPHNSTDGLHAGVVGGDEWDIDDEELADMTTSEIIWLRDQKNHRTIAPFYDLADDTSKDYGDDLEVVTNCFAVKFLFNNTINVTDGSNYQVNFTLYERDYNDLPIEVVFSGVGIYAIFHQPITCYNQLYSFEFDVALASWINCTSVTTIRVFTPTDDDNLGDETLINTAPLWA